MAPIAWAASGSLISTSSPIFVRSAQSRRSASRIIPGAPLDDAHDGSRQVRDRLTERGQPVGAPRSLRNVVETNHGKIVGDTATALEAGSVQEAQSKEVGDAEHPVDIVLGEQSECGFTSGAIVGRRALLPDVRLHPADPGSRTK